MTPEELQRKQINAILDALEALLAVFPRSPGPGRYTDELTKAQEKINRLRNLVVKGTDE